MKEMDNASYRDLVLEIYQAVSDPAQWVNVMDRVSDLVSARGGMIIEMRTREGERRLEIPLMTSNYDRDIVEEYFENFRAEETRDHDVFDRRLLERDGIDLLSEEILYSDPDDYLNRPHVQALAKRGIAHRTGALLDKDNPYRARFSLSMGKERGLFDSAETAVIKDILPHIAKALEMSRPAGAPGDDHRTFLSLIEMLNIGVCLIDSMGRCAETNSEFRRQQEEYKAFSTDINGRVRIGNARNQAQASKLLEDALNHAKFGARPRKEAILVEMPDAATTLCVEIVPLRKSDAIGTREFNGALLLSRDISNPVEFDVDLAQQVFELTSTETSVLRMVSDGLTNPEIADRRERSVETINAQMKSILGKTRAMNRTQLVRLLCNFSPPGTDIKR